LSTEEINSSEHANDILGADADEDGQVTLDELVSDISEKQSSMPPMGPPPNESAEETATNIMNELDTNGDGVLSAAEIAAGGEQAQNISGADADGDGQVTLDELVSDIEENQPSQDQDLSSLTSTALDYYTEAQSLLDETETSALSLVA